MRPLLAAAFAFALLVPLAPAVAHEPYACATNRPFPSADARVWQPGHQLVYYVPGGQFITVTSSGPIDVSMVLFSACDSTGCDVHGATGTTVCEAQRFSVVEIANRGAAAQLVLLAIGICGSPHVCAPFA